MLEFYFLPCSISVWHLGLWGKCGWSDLVAGRSTCLWSCLLQLGLWLGALPLMQPPSALVDVKGPRFPFICHSIKTLLLRNRAPQSLSLLCAESTPQVQPKQTKDTKAIGSLCLSPQGITGCTLMKLSQRPRGEWLPSGVPGRSGAESSCYRIPQLTQMFLKPPAALQVRPGGNGGR